MFTINDVMLKLAELQQLHGDLPCRVYVTDGSDDLSNSELSSIFSSVDGVEGERVVYFGAVFGRPK